MILWLCSCSVLLFGGRGALLTRSSAQHQPAESQARQLATISNVDCSGKMSLIMEGRHRAATLLNSLDN